MAAQTTAFAADLVKHEPVSLDTRNSELSFFLLELETIEDKL